jgi:hypothetical protein
MIRLLIVLWRSLREVDQERPYLRGKGAASHHYLIPTMSTLETYQVQLVNDSLSVGALKFGSFTLKSGRCVLMLPLLRARPFLFMVTRLGFPLIFSMLALSPLAHSSAHWVPLTPRRLLRPSHQGLNASHHSMSSSVQPTRASPSQPSQLFSYTPSTTLMSVSRTIERKPRTTAKVDAWSGSLWPASASSSSTT